MSGSARKGKGKAIAFLREHVTYAGEGCLIWPFFRDYEGYGRLGYDGLPMVKAHRWMCEAINGPAPAPEYYASHLCGNGHLGCVHPEHLAWKTHAGNTEDFIKSGRRTPRKGRHPRKLTPEQVQIILNPPADKTLVQVAAECGVTYRHAKKIRQGISWRGGVTAKPNGRRCAPPVSIS